MGTNVFFIESDKPRGSDPNFREHPAKSYEYFNKSNKVLKMNRIFVEEITQDASEQATTSTVAIKKDPEEDVELLKVTKTYEEALNQFLRPGEEPPRSIPQKVERPAAMKVEESVEESDNAEQAAESSETETLSQEIAKELNQLLSEDIDET